MSAIVCVNGISYGDDGIREAGGFGCWLARANCWRPWQAEIASASQ
jgi:hypothetical protein